MFNFSEGNSFDEIMERLLDRVSDSLDKRQGSIIYDALAPAAAELAQNYISLEVFADQTYLMNAVGENLDNRVVDYGLTRNPATYAQRIGLFKDVNDVAMDIEIGTRFSTPVEFGGLVFEVISRIEQGKFILQCETAGTVGNEYIGDLLPLVSVNNLGSAELQEVHIAGEDIEDDENLRERALDKLRETPFGGNIADYKQFMEAQDGIGGCLVIPIWNGGGTVKLVVITSSYDIPTQTRINELQELVDPIQNQGQGLGKAPIGHSVTVVAPTAYNLLVQANIDVQSENTLSSLEDDIKTAIINYINTVQKEWADNTSITIYISRIIAAILMVPGVTNVSSVTLNGSSSDITIDNTSAGNPYPIINEEDIILNES